MSSFGSAISPKFYQDNTVRALTRMALARLVVRALIKVGMVFKPAYSYADMTDPLSAQIPVGQTGLVCWIFDFPGTDNFSINGTNYKPCFIFWMGNGSSGSTDNNAMADGMGCLLACRTDTTIFDPTSVTSYTSNRFSTAAFGLASGGNSQPAYMGGAWYRNYLWMAYEGEPNAVNHNVHLNVGNIFVALTPGGLQVSIGTGADKLGFSAYIGTMVVFMGARIPSRGLSPSSDPNLTRMFPAVQIPFATTDSEFIGNSTTGAGLIGWALGGQYNLINTLLPIQMPLYNLENIEQPAFPSTIAPTLRSPRLVSGTPRHVMNRCVGYANNQRSSSTIFYSFIDIQIDSSVARPPWTEFWDAPGFRFCDRIAPAGLYQDPVTGLHWFLSWCQTIQGMVAIAAEGWADASAVAVDWTTIGTTDSYDVTAAGFASTFPTTATATASGSTLFTAIASNNQFHASHNSASGVSGFLDWVITRNPADPDGIAYWVKFDARCRRTGGTTEALANCDVWIADQFVSGVSTAQGQINGANGRLLTTIPSAIASGGNGYDFATYAFPIPFSAVDKKFRICFRMIDTTTTAGTLDFTIQNLRIERRTKT